MSTAMMPFEFEGAQVRVLMRDALSWWVLADVCRVLEISNPSNVARRLADDEKMTLHNVEGRAGHGARVFNLVNESGLYATIMTSRKPQAQTFRRWVTGTVLPALRRDGAYAIGQERAGATDRTWHLGLSCEMDELWERLRAVEASNTALDKRVSAAERRPEKPAKLAQAVVAGPDADVLQRRAAIVDAAWSQRINSTRKQVLVALASRSSINFRAACSVQDLMSLCGLAERTVTRALRDLVGAGLIKVVERASAGSVYRLFP